MTSSAPHTDSQLQGTYLGEIIAAHRRTATADDRPISELEQAAAAAPAPRGFAQALANQDGTAVIAEVKRRSPSKGDLRPDLDAGELACSYARGGAAALSVLTDSEFFGGSAEDLSAARSSTGLPVLRKDFTVSERDLFDARAMGADAVLLIVAALSRDELKRFASLADQLSMDALMEVHDQPELELALELGARLVGVNQRDLHSFKVDTKRARQLAERIPPDVTSVAESGIESPSDVAALTAAGYDAVLVGESLITSADPGSAVAAMADA